MTAPDLVRHLHLLPHPEGGYYRETYRSAHTVTTDEAHTRNGSTAIYYLLENEDRSCFHRIKSDELWFFHKGQTLEIVLIADGQATTIILGNDLEKGEQLQAVVPANTWFAAQVKQRVGYALVSCTVAPGFDFTDFELAERAELTAQFPHLQDLIEKFT
ncbi:cupin domain-containing protein [Hymenobacter sp. BT186]|uniref:Cupin domain-containing protein n=1 Tax=Hymenobacter telluris TaxID=2816474 RepID=A0A939JCG4_9BACT|nr:cupin domain-containing protein [Hymenobacter telluris]MBO0358345.1 cupin domain-containing protein [Hymenobacter telluris]MBW3374371.1 cupin domain-containing protein [Hymenobacter norwichensis]